MKATIKLLNSYYIKGFFGPFFQTIFPLMLLFIMGNAFSNGPTATTEYMRNITAGILITALLSSGIIGLPMMIIEFKKSTMMKRIGAAHITKTQFLLSVIIYQTFWAVFTVIWILLWSGIIIGTKEKFDWSVAFSPHLAESIPFIILSFVLSITMGMFIVSLINTQQGVMAITNILYLPISFLSGSFLPKTQIDNSSVLNGISYMLPTKYAVDPFFDVFNGGFDALNGWESWGYPLISITLIIAMLFVSVKKFKWGK